MGPVWFLARSGATRRLVSGLVLAALLAVAGAVVLASLAGARRTDSAYTRLSELTGHPDLVVTPEGDPSLFDPSIVTDAPGVAALGTVHGFSAAELRPDGTVDIASGTALLAPADTTAFHELDRPIVLEGRLPDPGAADEIAVARESGLRVGSVIDTCLVDFNEVLAFGQGILEGTATHEQQLAFVDEVCAVHQLRVVGVMRFGPDEVVLRESSESDVFNVGTPALAADAGVEKTFSFVLVDFEPGADVQAFVDSVLDRAPPETGVSVQAASLRATVVDRTIEPYVRVLALFAAVAAIAALGVLGPTVVRWAGTPERDRAPLLAVGLRPNQLRLASVVRGATLGLGAAAGAVAIAASASGRFPIGVARRAEPDPGLRLDAAVLITGAIVIVALCAGLGAVAATSGRTRPRRPSRVAAALQASSARPAILAGVRAALSRDGGGAARTAGGVGVAVVTVVTALTYQAGLGRLLDTPERYGWTSDVLIDGVGDPLPDEVLDAVDSLPSVTALSPGYRSVLLGRGASVQTFAFESTRGDAHPSILEGRAPRGDTEIALGGQALQRLDAAIGDRLTFRGSNGARVELTVVGQTLLPFLSLGQDLSVAEGGLVDVALLDHLGGADVSLALVDLVPGATGEGLRTDLDDRGPTAGFFEIQGPSHTADLRGYDGVRRTPLLLAGLLAVLGLGVLAHTIATAARRRRHELAVFRCIGFENRDLRATVRWYALTLAGLCLLVGVPVGVALGRTLWSSFARGIGVGEDALTPAWPVTAVVGVTLVGAIALAVLPGRQASRVRPAEVLRTE